MVLTVQVGAARNLSPIPEGSTLVLIGAFTDATRGKIDASFIQALDTRKQSSLFHITMPKMWSRFIGSVSVKKGTATRVLKSISFPRKAGSDNATLQVKIMKGKTPFDVQLKVKA